MTSTDLREEAEELRALARKVSFLPDKALLMDLASSLLEQAERAEAQEDRSWRPRKQV